MCQSAITAEPVCTVFIGFPVVFACHVRTYFVEILQRQVRVGFFIYDYIVHHEPECGFTSKVSVLHALKCWVWVVGCGVC